MSSRVGIVREVVQLERRDGACGLRAWRQDAVDGKKRRWRPLGQRAAQQKSRAEQRRRLARPAVARPAHAGGLRATLKPQRLLHLPRRRHPAQQLVSGSPPTRNNAHHSLSLLLILTDTTPLTINSSS